MTKKIIVPTDFSDNALTAIRYACKLAAQKSYAIHLFHCYTSSSSIFEEEVNNKETSIPLLKADMDMLDLKEKLQGEFPSIQIESTCTRGLLTELLPAKATAPEYALIVMGTTGTGKGKSLAWGSNASNITSRARIPVLAVPHHTHNFSLEKVGMLTNFKAEELDTLQEYITLVAPIPHLDIIHVYNDSDDPEEVSQQLEEWSKHLQHIEGTTNVNCMSRTTNNNDENIDTIPEVINLLIQENNYDILLVTKTRRSFFQRLFGTSVSKEIVLDLERPTFFDNN